MTGRPPGPRIPAADRGSVTAELAIGMIAVVALLVVILAVGAATAVRSRCSEAARTGARAAAIGDDDATVQALAIHVAGPDAQVAVSRSDGWVTVTVGAPLAGSGPAAGLRGRASATARDEP